MTPPAALSPGLCSVTFRSHRIAEVAQLAAGAGLAGIEWGGDVHVPAGDTTRAAEAARATADAGLRVASYGSYLFADPPGGTDIGPALDSAEALGTDLVRVWCPFGIEPTAGPADRAAVAGVLAGWAEAARARHLRLYLEFHGGTLTATTASARALLDEVGSEVLSCGWQPAYWLRSPGDPGAAEAELAELADLAPWLAHVHVYEWTTTLDRRPLSEGVGHWPATLARASAGRTGLDRFALLEFVAGDEPAALARDAATLLAWLAEVPG